MDTVKAEKDSAMRRYRRLGRALRWLEACAALLVISRFSASLPAATRVSGDILRSATAFLITPGFVFVVGNAIVLVLFAKSRHLASSSSGDLYDEFLKGRDRTHNSVPPAEERKVVCEDKGVCAESLTLTLRRSRSDGAGRRRRRGAAELRRTESEVVALGEEKLGRAAAAEMSAEEAEEFRRTVEAFIAKQVRFRREESMAVDSFHETKE